MKREKYQTNASKAEKHVLEMLRSDKNIIRPWGLIDYNMESRTLETTVDEIRILFENSAHVRPGYEVSDKKVFIPNIFVKISGYSDTCSFLYSKEALKGFKDTFIYNSIDDFNNKNAAVTLPKDSINC